MALFSHIHLEIHISVTCSYVTNTNVHQSVDIWLILEHLHWYSRHQKHNLNILNCQASCQDCYCVHKVRHFDGSAVFCCVMFCFALLCSSLFGSACDWGNGTLSSTIDHHGDAVLWFKSYRISSHHLRFAWRRRKTFTAVTRFITHFYWFDSYTQYTILDEILSKWLRILAEHQFLWKKLIIMRLLKTSTKRWNKNSGNLYRKCQYKSVPTHFIQ